MPREANIFWYQFGTIYNPFNEMRDHMTTLLEKIEIILAEDAKKNVLSAEALQALVDIRKDNETLRDHLDQADADYKELEVTKNALAQDNLDLRNILADLENREKELKLKQDQYTQDTINFAFKEARLVAERDYLVQSRDDVLSMFNTVFSSRTVRSTVRKEVPMRRPDETTGHYNQDGTPQYKSPGDEIRYLDETTDTEE